MSTYNQRAIYSDNGALTDISVEMNDYMAGSRAFAGFASADYLYIGAALPFNQKYFYLGSVVNDEASTVSVGLWDGSSFVSAVDVIDRTSASGKSLAQSGYISFRPDIDNAVWKRQQRSEDVTGLDGTEIYNLYWARFSWSAAWTASTEIKHLGHRFNTDTELYAQYPNLNNATLRASFNGGSATNNWDVQTFAAAETIIADLMERSVIMTADQILDATKLKLASVHKTAEIIYGGFGVAYDEHRQNAAKAYSRAINMKNFYVDLNRSADLEKRERITSTVSLHR